MMYLNAEMAAIAKCNLKRDDLYEMAEKHDIAVSSIVQIVSGKRKAKPEVIDTILDWTKKRMQNNIDKL